MNVSFARTFLSDLKKIRDRVLIGRIESVVETFRHAETLLAVSGVVKLQGEKSYYRVRIGEWRIGFRAEGQDVVFLRCLNRREFYRFFP